MAINDYNPFSKRESHTRESVITYKVLTILSWLLLVITALFYTSRAPEDGHYLRRAIFAQSHAHPTPYTLSHVFVGIYWIVLFILQAGYVWHLFSKNEVYQVSAANVGSHFILSNLFFFAYIMLWVRSEFAWAEVILVVQFFNLLALYLRHATTPRFIHIPVVSMPLAWTFVSLFWTGAIAVHSGAHDTPARIVANVFLWSWLVFGGFFLVVFKDYTLGFALSFLTAALGVAQFSEKVVALQWIFAFTIMGVLFIFTVLVAVPGIFGGRFGDVRGSSSNDDRERAPLLDDH
jgi:hypothetical protein